jgi:hypothetical protein
MNFNDDRPFGKNQDFIAPFSKNYAHRVKLIHEKRLKDEERIKNDPYESRSYGGAIQLSAPSNGGRMHHSQRTFGLSSVNRRSRLEQSEEEMRGRTRSRSFDRFFKQEDPFAPLSRSRSRSNSSLGSRYSQSRSRSMSRDSSRSRSRSSSSQGRRSHSNFEKQLQITRDLEAKQKQEEALMKLKKDAYINYLKSKDSSKPWVPSGKGPKHDESLHKSIHNNKITVSEDKLLEKKSWRKSSWHGLLPEEKEKYDKMVSDPNNEERSTNSSKSGRRQKKKNDPHKNTVKQHQYVNAFDVPLPVESDPNNRRSLSRTRSNDMNYNNNNNNNDKNSVYSGSTFRPASPTRGNNSGNIYRNLFNHSVQQQNTVPPAVVIPGPKDDRKMIPSDLANTMTTLSTSPMSRNNTNNNNNNKFSPSTAAQNNSNNNKNTLPSLYPPALSNEFAAFNNEADTYSVLSNRTTSSSAGRKVVLSHVSAHLALTIRMISQVDEYTSDLKSSYGILAIKRGLSREDLICAIEKQFDVAGKISDISIASKQAYSGQVTIHSLSMNTIPDYPENNENSDIIVYLGGALYQQGNKDKDDEEELNLSDHLFSQPLRDFRQLSSDNKHLLDQEDLLFYDSIANNIQAFDEFAHREQKIPGKISQRGRRSGGVGGSSGSSVVSGGTGKTTVKTDHHHEVKKHAFSIPRNTFLGAPRSVSLDQLVQSAPQEFHPSQVNALLRSDLVQQQQIQEEEQEQLDDQYYDEHQRRFCDEQEGGPFQREEGEGEGQIEEKSSFDLDYELEKEQQEALLYEQEQQKQLRHSSPGTTGYISSRVNSASDPPLRSLKKQQRPPVGAIDYNNQNNNSHFHPSVHHPTNHSNAVPSIASAVEVDRDHQHHYQSTKDEEKEEEYHDHYQQHGQSDEDEKMNYSDEQQEEDEEDASESLHHPGVHSLSPPEVRERETRTNTGNNNHHRGPSSSSMIPLPLTMEDIHEVNSIRDNNNMHGKQEKRQKKSVGQKEPAEEKKEINTEQDEEKNKMNDLRGGKNHGKKSIDKLESLYNKISEKSEKHDSIPSSHPLTTAHAALASSSSSSHNLHHHNYNSNEKRRRRSHSPGQLAAAAVLPLSGAMRSSEEKFLQRMSVLRNSSSDPQQQDHQPILRTTSSSSSLTTTATRRRKSFDNNNSLLLPPPQQSENPISRPTEINQLQRKEEKINQMKAKKEQQKNNKNNNEEERGEEEAKRKKSLHFFPSSSNDNETQTKRRTDSLISTPLSPIPKISEDGEEEDPHYLHPRLSVHSPHHIGSTSIPHSATIPLPLHHDPLLNSNNSNSSSAALRYQQTMVTSPISEEGNRGYHQQRTVAETGGQQSSADHRSPQIRHSSISSPRRLPVRSPSPKKQQKQKEGKRQVREIFLDLKSLLDAM